MGTYVELEYLPMTWDLLGLIKCDGDWDKSRSRSILKAKCNGGMTAQMK